MPMPASVEGMITSNIVQKDYLNSIGGQFEPIELEEEDTAKVGEEL